MSLAEYLAKNYLTADPKPEKSSRKRKRKDASNGVTIADDDALGWDKSSSINADEDTPLTVTGRTSEFRKAKNSTWQTLGAPTLSSTEQAAADVIIASAAAETSARTNADEDDPVIEDSAPAAKMQSGAHAGLQTAEQVTRQLRKQQAEERARFMADDAVHGVTSQETIYRDASGRIINIAMKRAEARKKAEEEAAKAAAELEAQKGDVQRAASAKRKEDLREAKYMPVARHVDDVEMNEELKGKDRWNDPAAGFIAKKAQGKSVTGKPIYKGAAMPNRYGIQPGHRWDGVDRGNGFEKEYFAAQNKKRNLKELDYAWQMDE
ncbi:MAG: hypothetical protein Q9195_004556 [Heterodermia aff. obscurata]